MSYFRVRLSPKQPNELPPTPNPRRKREYRFQAEQLERTEKTLSTLQAPVPLAHFGLRDWVENPFAGGGLAVRPTLSAWWDGFRWPSAGSSSLILFFSPSHLFLTKRKLSTRPSTRSSTRSSFLLLLLLGFFQTPRTVSPHDSPSSPAPTSDFRPRRPWRSELR